MADEDIIHIGNGLIGNGLYLQSDETAHVIDVSPYINSMPIATIGPAGHPVTIGTSEGRQLCVLDIDSTGRWTATYDSSDLDDAARRFLDAVNMLAATAVREQRP